MILRQLTDANPINESCEGLTSRTDPGGGDFTWVEPGGNVSAQLVTN